MLNWGIISAGRICQQFAADMEYVSNGTVKAVAARNLDDAKAFADKYSIERAYGSYQQLFNDSGIDIVYIGTPHTFHFEQAKAAMLAGKHVVCEKPITVGSSEMKALSLLAKEQGVYLLEAMWTYFLPAIQKAKQWIDEGRIGEIKHIKADFGYPMAYDPNTRVYNKSLAGGCLLDMGIYPIAFANLFLKAPIQFEYVNAELAPNGVDNDVLMLGKSDDVKATLATSFQCKLNNYGYVIGDKGYIAIHDFWRANSCSLFEGEQEIERFEDNRQSIGLNFEAQAAGEDILAGKLESPIVSHQQSLNFQQQMEQVKALF
ncbi:Gfo/Idh/MocA family protein [Thalassotalea euphylliae]|uniref:Gfo/Idh/MocA family protein n=1 Tax=Thalassotalea euphylliae TaxID=1655234 RepID=UPI0036296CD5